MNLIPDKVGGSKKQYITLGVLGVVLVAVYLFERTPSSPEVSAPAAAPVAGVTTPPPITRERALPQAAGPGLIGPRLATRGGQRSDDFRPSVKLPEGMDVTRIDPTLRLDLLAKLQNVPFEGGSRSVFDWGQAPVPPPPKVPPIKPGEIARADQKAKEEEAKAKEAFAKTQHPPIPLKFYGYASKVSGAAREAFFLDGDEIEIKRENDVIHGRYKVIRIGINSAVVEDLNNHEQETLPLVAELKS